MATLSVSGMPGQGGRRLSMRNDVPLEIPKSPRRSSYRPGDMLKEQMNKRTNSTKVESPHFSLKS